MANNDTLMIDVEEVIRKKNPRLAKRMPRLILRYLKRIAHQDEMNKFFSENQHKKDHEFVQAVIDRMNITPIGVDFGNVPENGRFIFAANHPLGALESIVLMSLVAEKYRDISFIVNDLLMHVTQISGLWLPINKHGSQSRESVEIVNEAYRSDKQILLFPAGLVSRKIRGQIVDLDWKKSFVVKAIESKRDVIPVYIDGKNSKFFYNLARLRKFFRIKTNIEMLYLVNELFKHEDNTITLVFGKPIPYTSFDKTKSYNEWASYVKDVVYSLKK